MQNLQRIRANVTQRQIINNSFAIMGLLTILVAVIILVGLVLVMMSQGLPRLHLDFLLKFPSSDPTQAGILSAWVGSGLIMIITAIAAVPLGIASGIYLEEYARKNLLSEIIEINVTNLAGVPSIIYGLLALGLFIYKFSLGQSILTAGLTLALLILPIIIVTTRESLRSIPNDLREAAYAAGSSKWQMIWDHVLPYSFGSILTGIIIGLSRAIGETAPLLTIGALTFIAFLPDSPINNTFPFIPFQGDFPFLDLHKLFAWIQSPFTVMPIQMYAWISRPEPEFAMNAAAAGTVLIFMTLFMNGFAIYLRYYFRKKIKW